MMLRKLLILAASACVVAGAARPASAEIVYLTSKKTLSIDSHRFDGDFIILKLRGGGELTCDRTLVERIVPDEVPYVSVSPEAAEPKPLGTSGKDDAPVEAEILEKTPYGEVIAAVSEAHGVNPMLVRAVIQVESNYRPRARSSKGAMGLMQLMPATARAYNVRNPYDPKANIAAGVKHLKTLIDKWGVELALAAYNAGEGAVKKFNGVPPYRETRSYVSKILSLAGIR
ncbi:MAG TPA: lytic transglycosylase domain-containing protein [Vicinamibacterales bacterium]